MMSVARHWRRDVPRWLRDIPFTISFLITLWVIGLATGTVRSGPRGTLLNAIGFGTPSIAHHRWWSPVSSLLWAGGLTQYLGVTVVIVLLCGLAERRLGTLRTIAAFVSTSIVGAMLCLTLLHVGASLGEPWSRHLKLLLVVTPSAAAFGVSMVASATLPATWRTRLRLMLLMTMGMLTLYGGAPQDLSRLCAGLAGLALAPLIVRPGERPPRAEPSKVEARLLIATLVAASAIGPLVATAPHTPGSPPLSILQFLLSAPHPTAADIAASCTDPTASLDCAQLHAALRLSGPGPALLSVIPVLILAVMAEGLRRGRRFAWWGALAANLALTTLGLLLLPYEFGHDARPISPRGWTTDVLPLLQPALVLALLLVFRGKFTVRAPRGAYRRLAAVVGSTFTACAAIYITGAYVVRDQFTPSPSLAQIIADLPLRFAPPGYLGELPITFVPVDTGATALYGWTGVLFWCVALGACLATFVRARIDVRPADRARAAALLRRYGGTSTSHMITWPGNNYWFSPDGKSVVAYRVIAAIALTTGEPVGEPGTRRTAVEQFARYCTTMGWTPCFYGVTDDIRATLDTGWNVVQVAEEAVLPLPGLQFRGKAFQDVRTALNKANTLGIQAQRIRYRDASPPLADQIRLLSRDWLTSKQLPEMGFTLGTLNELADDDVWCLVAVDRNQTLHGVTSWLPIRNNGEIIGWTLDLMRRSGTAFPGVMEFLIASMVQRCQADGAELLSLSGAPLARANHAERPTPLQRILDLLGTRLEPLYGFRSLLAFKTKFQPQHRPLLMAYPDAVALPSIGNAVARAYLPTLTPRQTLRLLRAVLVGTNRPHAPSPVAHRRADRTNQDAGNPEPEDPQSSPTPVRATARMSSPSQRPDPQPEGHHPR